MTDLKEFRKTNGLTQDELGAYLGMKKSFISKIENQKEKLPQPKLQKLLENPFGWDISNLTKNIVANEIKGDNPVIGHHNEVNHSAAINKLVDEIAAHRKQIDRLLDIIEEQMKMLNR